MLHAYIVPTGFYPVCIIYFLVYYFTYRLLFVKQYCMPTCDNCFRLICIIYTAIIVLSTRVPIRYIKYSICSKLKYCVKLNNFFSF